MRVIARDGEAVVDRSATLSGRGAWVHPTRKCIDTAIQRKAFGRALKSESALATGQILTMIDASTEAPKEQAD